MSDIEQTNVETTSSWTSSLDEGLRNEASINKFNDVNSLAKSYVHLEKRLGNSIYVGDENLDVNKIIEKVPNLMVKPDVTSDEGKTSLYNMLGRPEKFEDYKVELGEDANLDTSRIDSHKELAHKLGLNNQQFNEIVKLQYQQEVAEETIINKYMEEQTVRLQKEWGNDFDSKVQGAHSALKMYADKYGESLEMLEGQVTPSIMAALSDLYASMKNKPAGIQASPGNYVNESAQEIENKINQKMLDRDFTAVYTNPAHPGYLNAQKQITDMYKSLQQARKIPQ
jgi:hypothetical protein